MDVFTPLVLACLIDGSRCMSFTNNQVTTDLSKCQQMLVFGINEVTAKGWVAVVATCYNFNVDKEQEKKDDDVPT